MEAPNPPKLLLTAGTRVCTAALHYNVTAREFAALRPPALTLRDYAGTEQISDLPGKLSTKDAPAGYQPSAGDLALYAPWGNLALFYQNGDYASGLVALGRLDAGLAAGKVAVQIERLP